MAELDTSPAVLVIAGSDSSGGAGIQRDLHTLANFNVVALCAITAVTAQSNTQLTDTHHLPSANIQQQIASAFATRRISAIKIGMLGTGATVTAVVNSLVSGWGANDNIPIVLDPVLVSSSGGILLDETGMAALKTQLLPYVTLLTPNLPEAAMLLQTSVAANEVEVIEQARHLLQLGPQAVLIKGGHAASDHAHDLLLVKGQSPLWLSARRISANLRGTGCALASAIAALLALGKPLDAACQHAKHYVLKELSQYV